MMVDDQSAETEEGRCHHSQPVLNQSRILAFGLDQEKAAERPMSVILVEDNLVLNVLS